MSIVLDQEIYKWLLGLDVIKMTTLSQQLPDGRVELDPSVTSYFSTGLIFSRLITKIVKNLSKTSNMSHINLSNLDSIKFTPTPASLTYNWNLIADVLKQLNVNVDPDVKGLVIDGDIEMINELLHEIHTVYHPNRNSPVRSIATRKVKKIKYENLLTFVRLAKVMRVVKALIKSLQRNKDWVSLSKRTLVTLVCYSFLNLFLKKQMQLISKKSKLIKNSVQPTQSLNSSLSRCQNISL